MHTLSHLLKLSPTTNSTNMGTKIIFLSFFFPLLSSFSEPRRVTLSTSLKSPNTSIPAVFVFGDSTSDPGNNNYVQTPFRSNFLPYGRDLPKNIRDRRFSNGRLTSDFVAEYVGIKKYIPPYLDRAIRMDDLMTGVSFASAGSGFDPFTSQILSGVIAMETQLEYFREYKTQVEGVIGKEKMEVLIKEALFIVSSGTNDFVVNYYTLPVRRVEFGVVDYQLFLMKYVEQFIKGLWELGARKIAVAGLPPMGCLPLVITANAKADRGCINFLNVVAKDYNKLLQQRLDSLLVHFLDHTTKIGYIDVFSPLASIIDDPTSFGFEEVNNGCCGTGYIEVWFLCNPGSYTCPDASKYVFWDAIHPTQATYYLVFESMRPLIDFLVSH